MKKMPDEIKARMMKVTGKDYLPALVRIMWFRDDHPDWRIITEIVNNDDEKALVKASIYNSEGILVSTAHKTQSRKQFPMGYVEKAETGAVGRALAYVGYGSLSEGDDDDVCDAPVDNNKKPIPAEPRPVENKSSDASAKTAMSSALATLNNTEGWDVSKKYEKSKFIELLKKHAMVKENKDITPEVVTTIAKKWSEARGEFYSILPESFIKEDTVRTLLSSILSREVEYEADVVVEEWHKATEALPDYLNA